MIFRSSPLNFMAEAIRVENKDIFVKEESLTQKGEPIQSQSHHPRE